MANGSSRVIGVIQEAPIPRKEEDTLLQIFEDLVNFVTRKSQIRDSGWRKGLGRVGGF